MTRGTCNTSLSDTTYGSKEAYAARCLNMPSLAQLSDFI